MKSELNLVELKKIEGLFRDRFERASEILVAAPGRVNVIGEHVDYNDGFVLPMAVERYVWIMGARASDRSVARFESIELGQQIKIPLGQPIPAPNPATDPNDAPWSRYLQGTIANFQRKGISIPGFDALIKSTLPIGGGLSSSAALTVAAATFLQTLTQTTLHPRELALLCQDVEHRFAHVPCGIMDQFSSVFGKPNELMLIDCRSQEIEPVPLNDDSITMLVINSKVQHDLASGQYALRRQECDAALAKLNQTSWRNVTQDQLDSSRKRLSPVELKRATHIVTEIARTLAAADSFQQGNWDQVGQLMSASHESLRKNFEVSTPELDLLVQLASEFADRDSTQSVYGARMTGGGFGGCVLALLKTESVSAFTEFVTARYESRTGIQPELFTSSPARGAHVVFSNV